MCREEEEGKESVGKGKEEERQAKSTRAHARTHTRNKEANHQKEKCHLLTYPSTSKEVPSQSEKQKVSVAFVTPGSKFEPYALG